jgi:hypothetical protein
MGEDLPYYEEIGAQYRKITGLKGKEAPETDGNFHSWAYTQLGLPALAARVWGPPEAEAKDAEKKEEGGAPPKQEQPKPPEGEKPPEAPKPLEAKPPEAKPPEQKVPEPAPPKPVAEEPKKEPAPPPAGPPKVPLGEEPGGRRGRRGPGPEPKKEDTGDDLAWLKFSDKELKGAGFVPWKGFSHPTLGEVEIGGFAPVFKVAPPPERIAALIEKQAEFVLYLGGLFPRVKIARADVKAQGGNVFLIEAEVENEGYLPTALQMGVRNRDPRPTFVRLNLEGQRILAGPPRDAVPSLPGSGGRRKTRWTVSGAPGSKVTLVVDAEKGGMDSRALELK